MFEPIPGFAWPHLSCMGFCGERFFSQMNPWIDFVVLYDPSEYDRGYICKTVEKALDAFWDGEYECYGDAVEVELMSAGIVKYMMVYHDSEDESAEYEEQWEKWIKDIPNSPVSEDTVSRQEWFGIVRWCEEDIADALDRHGIPATQSNIDEIRVRCEHHFFTDAMIETGWSVIESFIDIARMEGKLNDRPE